MIFGPEIKTIVFDMDGVLWHSSAIHAAAYQAVLEGAGLIMPRYETIAGRRTDEVMREILARHKPAEGDSDAGTIVSLTEAKQARARELLRDQPPIAPECAAILAELASSRSLALASSASADTVKLFLEASGTGVLFKAVVSGRDVAAAKPDGAIYIEALRRAGCQPAEAAVVDDAPSGIQAARAARVRFVVGIEGTVARNELLSAGAHRVVRTLRDLLTQS